MKDSTYLVVGGSSGIGLELVRRLKRRGAEVHVWSRSFPEELKELDVVYSEFDATRQAEEAELPALPERLDGLVYCPGSIRLNQFKRLSADDFREDFELNLIAAVRVLQRTEKLLRAGDGASVVLFSTVAVQTGMAFHASVAAAKGAVEGLARSLAAEYASQKIRVNCVAPSATDTPLAQRVIGNEKQKKASAERHPLGRIGEASDIAAAAEYLLSSDSGWVTGQVLHVDGGISSVR